MLFTIAEGRNINVFFQDPLTNVHVLWRRQSVSEEPQRLQFCFPEGNCGVGVDLSGRLELEPSVTSWGEVGGLRGASVTLQARGTVVVGETCLDSLRALRDWKDPEAHRHRREGRRDAGFVEPVWTDLEGRTWERRTLGLARRWTMVLSVEASPGVVVEETSSGLVLRGPEGLWTLVLRGGHDHPALHPLGEARLLSADARTWLERLDPSETKQRVQRALRHLSFLAFEEKLLAGSWRFLTYFGRDTLLTSLLLGPTASLSLHEAALGSVVSRLSREGQVAHEEDIGEQAAYRRRTGEPIYDYKMVDDDFLLLPALQALSRHPEAGEWWPRFRARYEPALEANVRWCLGRLNGPVGLDHDVVGDWRDSNGGLGGGFYPNSVNVGLVPAFLEALSWYRGLPSPAETASWSEVPQRFLVHLSAEEVRRRAGAFLDSVPTSTAEGAWYRSRDLGGGVTIERWLEGQSVPILERGLTFSALSLDREGRPIEVIHSDLSFRLFLADPAVEELDVALSLLELPYPLGLAHPVGFLVANAALSNRPDLWEKLGRQGYHGAVVWSWQDAMITLGLRRQQRRTDLPAGLQDRLKRLSLQAREQQRLAGDYVASELWSWRIVEGRAVPVAYGAEEGDETESNAIQLWSSANLSLAAADSHG